MPNIKASGWLHILMEIKPRELDSRLLLACFAAARGHNVLIGPHRAFKRRMKRLPKGVVYDKSLHNFRTEEFQQFHKLGHRITVSDEESQSIYNMMPNQFLDSRQNDETLALCERYFVWGERQKEIMAEAFPIHKERFYTTGTPRTDIWREPFYGFYNDIAQSIRDKYGSFILMPSNFGFSMGAMSKELVLQQARDLKMLVSSEDEEIWENHFTFQSEVVEKYRHALSEVEKRFPNTAIIIRPHPVDNVERWKEVMSGLTNCHVVREGAAGPWLKAADAIIHHGCTTSLEAFFMGKYAITYKPLESDLYIEDFLMKTGPMTKTVDELLVQLERSLSGTISPDDIPTDDLRHMFYWEEGRYACEDIVDHVTQLISEDEALQTTQSVENMESGLYLQFRAWLRNKRRPLEKSGKFPDGLQQEEMEERVAYFGQVSDQLAGLEVKRASRDGLFHVYKP